MQFQMSLVYINLYLSYAIYMKNSSIIRHKNILKKLFFYSNTFYAHPYTNNINDIYT